MSYWAQKSQRSHLVSFALRVWILPITMIFKLLTNNCRIIWELFFVCLVGCFIFKCYKWITNRAGRTAVVIHWALGHSRIQSQLCSFTYCISKPLLSLSQYFLRSAEPVFSFYSIYSSDSKKVVLENYFSLQSCRGLDIWCAKEQLHSVHLEFVICANVSCK